MSKFKRSYENTILVILLFPLVYFFHEPSSFLFGEMSRLIMFILGLFISLFGLFLRLWARNFKANTHGKLATDGLYGYTRNPMYLASFLVGLGLSFTLRNIYLIIGYCVVFLVMHSLIILREERFLDKYYGEAYLDYKKNVPRWFPNLTRKVQVSINSDTAINAKNILIAVIRESNAIFGVLLLFLIVFFLGEDSHINNIFHIFDKIDARVSFIVLILLWLSSDIAWRIKKKNN